MYTLKLFNSWLEKGYEKVKLQQFDGEFVTKTRLSKEQIKDIDKIIRQSKVINETDEYMEYMLK